MRTCVLSHFSCVQLFATPWTVAHQAPLSMGFSWQEYWSGWPCLPPWDLPNSGFEPISLTSPALVDGFFTTSATWGIHKATLVFPDTGSEVKSLSRVRLFASPWTGAHLAPLSMDSSRKEYWSRLPCPASGNLPNPGMEPWSPALQAASLPFELPGKLIIYLWRVPMTHFSGSITC